MLPAVPQEERHLVVYWFCIAWTAVFAPATAWLKRLLRAGSRQLDITDAGQYRMGCGASRGTSYAISEVEMILSPRFCASTSGAHEFSGVRANRRASSRTDCTARGASTGDCGHCDENGLQGRTTMCGLIRNAATLVLLLSALAY